MNRLTLLLREVLYDYGCDSMYQESNVIGDIYYQWPALSLLLHGTLDHSSVVVRTNSMQVRCWSRVRLKFSYNGDDDDDEEEEEEEDDEDEDDDEADHVYL